MMFDSVQKKCSVCGHESEYSELSSISFFSSPDLDFRRIDLPLSLCIQECPHCGFVSSDISKKEDFDPRVLQLPQYTTCNGLNFSHSLTRSFYRRYLLDRHLNKHDNALDSIMRAFWAYEDDHPGVSEPLRLLALSEVDYLTVHAEPDNEIYLLIRADILRRLSRFDLVLKQFDEREFQQKEHQQIIRFQKRLSRKADSDKHNVDEVLKH